MPGLRVDDRAAWGRLLRRLCRCDGAKDFAVTAALLAIFGSLAIRLSVSPAAESAAAAVNIFS